MFVDCIIGDGVRSTVDVSVVLFCPPDVSSVHGAVWYIVL